jgi:hypothetical protein
LISADIEVCAGQETLKGLGEPGAATQTAASGFACRCWAWLNRISVAPIQASLRLLSPAGDPVPARDRRSAQRELDIRVQAAYRPLVPLMPSSRKRGHHGPAKPSIGLLERL